MTAHVVVDVGNTRIKWGRVSADGRAIDAVASLPDDPAAWETARGAWHAGITRSLRWAIASVQPDRARRLEGWLLGRGDRVVTLGAAQLPLDVRLPRPDRAGIDRLLNAVAACGRLDPDRPAVLIDAGSAVTVDWLDEQHAFRGGVIFPGLELMAEALHRYTALLPRVQVSLPVPAAPAESTIPAIQAGICLAVVGGIRETVAHYAAGAARSPRIFLTGGQAPLLCQAMRLLDPPQALPPPWHDFVLWPEQTLTGILRSVEGLP